MKIITIYETCECNICWETKSKFKRLKCNHQICTQCFPQIRNNLCPFCREPFRNSTNINIRRNENQNHQNHSFSNLSLDDNLLLEFADSFNDLHIRQQNRRGRQRQNIRRRPRRRRNRRNRRNRQNIENNQRNEINGQETNNQEETNNEETNNEETNNGENETYRQNRKKSRIKNRKNNRWNTLRNQYRNHHNYANSY